MQNEYQNITYWLGYYELINCKMFTNVPDTNILLLSIIWNMMPLIKKKSL